MTLTAPAPVPASTLPLPPLAAGHRALEVIEALIAANVTYVAAVPDTTNLHLLDALDADPRVTCLRVTAEDVGAAILYGVWIGGGYGALPCEGSGLGYSGLILARAVVDQASMLLLPGHTGLYGQRHLYHRAPALAGMGTLRGLHITYHGVRPGDDLPALVRSVGPSGPAMGAPTAIVVAEGSVTR